MLLTLELLQKMTRNNQVILAFFQAHDLLDQDYDQVIETVRPLDHELATWLIRNKNREEYLAYVPREEFSIDQGYAVFDHKMGQYKNFSTEKEVEKEIERLVEELLQVEWIQVHKRLTNTLGFENWVRIGKNTLTGATATQIVINNLVDQELLIDIRARIVTVPKNPG